MKIFTLAIISVLISVAAQFSLKNGVSKSQLSNEFDKTSVRFIVEVLSNYQTHIGFLLYGAGAIVWLLVLSKWDVSKAYPLVGLGFVFTLIVGAFIGEQVTFSRITGVLLICCGVWLVARS